MMQSQLTAGEISHSCHVLLASAMDLVSAKLHEIQFKSERFLLIRTIYKLQNSSGCPADLSTNQTVKDRD